MDARSRMAIFLTASLVPALLAVPGISKDNGDDKAPLGSPAYYPSPERPVGWRGDGSGKYPAAEPPVHWARAAKSVTELRSQAARPKEGETGKPIPDGVIREWLVLGPLPMPEGRHFTNEFIGAEGDLNPAENEKNEKAGENAWKKISLETSCLDFATLFDIAGKTNPVVAYACANLYSPDGQPLVLNYMHGGASRFWFNGKALYTSNPGANQAARLRLSPVKGWNRLVIKVSATGYVRPVIFGALPGEYESKNIAWTAGLPAPGYGSPLIVGDKIFASAEGGRLCCLEKASGKILWVRSSTYFDAATEEEKKANPDLFKALEPLAAKIKELDDAWLTDQLPKTLEERAKIEAQIYKDIARVDNEKYKLVRCGEAGYSAPSPVSDGRRVYAAFGSGLVVCYDLDGNRKWISLESHPDVEHGYSSSPLLADGKLLVYFGDLRALDAKTGAVAWGRPRFLLKDGNRTYCQFFGTGCVLPAGSVKVAFFLNGDFARVSDGKMIFADFWKYSGSRIASPVVDRGLIYKIASKDGGVMAIKLPEPVGDKLQPEIVKQVPFNTAKFPAKYYQTCYNASPLFHEGLMYCVDQDGVLTVVDFEKGDVLYQKALDLDLYIHHNFDSGRGGASSSPTLAGKFIYIFGDQGACLVIEPGRTYRQVAKNRVEYIAFPGHWRERQEITMSCPVFEGRRMYYRADANLHCVEEK